MIDTVILTIERDKFRSLLGGNIPQWELHSKRKGYSKMVRNQNSYQKKDGVYRPRIRGITRGRTKFMQIEFSIPKLILGNNLEEVKETDFKNVIDTLRQRLVDLGIVISNKELRDASVSSFHPSKNIILKEGYTSSYIIKEFNKINLTKKLDLNKDSFRNEGQSLQCYSNSHSLVIYDKMQDLVKHEKRAIDKDQTSNQRSLFDDLSTKKKQDEVLRLEVRLSRKVKMNQILKKLGYETGPTFKDIFKKDICQKIVQHYWETIIENENLFLFGIEKTPKKLLSDILSEIEPVKAKQAIYLVGLSVLCKEKDGIRDLRNVVSGNLSNRGWYRIATDIKSLNHIKSAQKDPWFIHIENTLKNFGYLRVRDGPEKEIIEITN
jgi:ribosomal protein L17